MAKAPVPQDGNDKAQRRVYVLPNELVERIGEYQRELGLSSEVDAVRRLLDNALKSRDRTLTIAYRIYSQKEAGKPLRDAIRDVTWDHPLLTSMNIEDGLITLRFSDRWSVRFEADEKATIFGPNDKPIHFEDKKPAWVSYLNTDDDMPF